MDQFTNPNLFGYFSIALHNFIILLHKLYQMDNAQTRPANLPKHKLQNLRNAIKSQRAYLNMKTRFDKSNNKSNRLLHIQPKFAKINQETDKAIIEQHYSSVSHLKSNINRILLLKPESKASVEQYIRSRKVKTEMREDKNISTCLQSINESDQIQQFTNNQSLEGLIRKKFMSTNHQIFRLKRSTDGKVRSKSQQINKILSRQQRINKFNQQRIRHSLQNKRSEVRYKNQKLNILHQQFGKVIKSIPEHMKDQKKFDKDARSLIQCFKNVAVDQSLLNRQMSQNFRTLIGKLIFFLGYEIYQRFDEQHPEKSHQQIIISNYYQMYFAMRFKIPLLILQCYLVLIDLALQKGAYLDAQKYSEKCLLSSIYYSQKYYEHRCIQKLSMCQYYKGNICQATYLHDNNGDITEQSRKKVRDGYNEQQQLDLIFHHLYETPRFDVREVLEDYNSRIDNYKTLIIFKTPRIGPDESMKYKMDQLKIDLIKMQRFKEFKSQVGIIKKQIKIHENLFVVKKQGQQNQNSFKLVKRNLVINDQNESSQVLRAHQSYNRITYINKKPIKKKLVQQFLQYLKKVLIRGV